MVSALILSPGPVPDLFAVGNLMTKKRINTTLAPGLKKRLRRLALYLRCKSCEELVSWIRDLRI